MDNILIQNINKIHTTKLGEERIRNNLNIDVDVIDYIKKMILDKNSKTNKKGKNYYLKNNNIIITINSYNYCVITGHMGK